MRLFLSANTPAPQQQQKPQRKVQIGDVLLAQKNFALEYLKEENKELKAQGQEMSLENLEHIHQIAKKGGLNNSLVSYLKVGGEFESFIGMEIPAITKENMQQVSQDVATRLEASVEGMGSMEGVSAMLRKTGKLFKYTFSKKAQAVAAATLGKKAAHVAGRPMAYASTLAKNTVIKGKLTKLAKIGSYTKIAAAVAVAGIAAAFIIKGLLKLINAQVKVIVSTAAILMHWKKDGLQKVDLAKFDKPASKSICNNLPEASSFDKLMNGIFKVTKVVLDAATPKMYSINDIKTLAGDIGYDVTASNELSKNNSIKYTKGTLTESGWNLAKLTSAADKVIELGSVVDKFKSDKELSKMIDTKMASVKPEDAERVAANEKQVEDEAIKAKLMKDLIKVYLKESVKLANGVMYTCEFVG